MKNIGILSMQRIKNYGSFLQAYGLKKIIEELGYDVQFVDYKVEKPIINDDEKNKNVIQKGLATLKGKAKFLHKIQYIKHKNQFGKKYYKLLNLTEKPNYTPKLDTLVIGSDEVFNCIQKNKNVGYSLELFGKDNNANKVISYAASFGNTTIEKIKKYDKVDELKKLLNNFSSISVRDANSSKVVEELIGKKTVQNLDPVLMFDYMKKCKEIPNINIKEKFMILYAYSGRISIEEAKFIKKYCKEKNIKIYSIGGAQPYADKFIDCSPFEVLAYFKNAEFIITDTFHGSIFSIINQKNFVTLVRKSVGNEYGNEEKLTDLLNRLKLSNRIIYDIKDINHKLNENINYYEIFKIIDKERENTYGYLKKNLN